MISCAAWTAPATPRRAGDSYGTLALLLSPWKSTAVIAGLREAIRLGTLDWGALIHQANRQFCTPLLYTRLREDGLLGAVSGEADDYLRVLYEANAERNQAFRDALRQLLSEFGNAGCAAVLLKGAATFFDDLYGAPGARMMGDLDILIEPAASDAARGVLRRLGYRFDAPHPDDGARLFTDNRHHHLPRAWLPGTPVVVELHTRVARRQGGRAIPESDAWRDRYAVTMEGVRAHVLSPTHRLLHNAVHALVPHCEFIRGEVSLANVTEFAYLARRYAGEVDWNEWRTRANRQWLTPELDAYVALAGNAMGMPAPYRLPPMARLNARRIILAAAVAPGQPSAAAKSAAGHWLTRMYVYAYFRLKRPLWLWRNYFYRAGLRHVPLRFGHLLLHLLRGSARLTGGRLG